MAATASVATVHKHLFEFHKQNASALHVVCCLYCNSQRNTLIESR
jgi:hypothetical protein